MALDFKLVKKPDNLKALWRFEMKIVKLGFINEKSEIVKISKNK